MGGYAGTVVVIITALAIDTFTGVDVADLVRRTVAVVFAGRRFLVGVVRSCIAVHFAAVDFSVTAVGLHNLTALAVVGAVLADVTVLVGRALGFIFLAARTGESESQADYRDHSHQQHRLLGHIQTSRICTSLYAPGAGRQ
jgi:hypothetical protein